jgi:hypothetical protein
MTLYEHIGTQFYYIPVIFCLQYGLQVYFRLLDF